MNPMILARNFNHYFMFFGATLLRKVLHICPYSPLGVDFDIITQEFRFPTLVYKPYRHNEKQCCLPTYWLSMAAGIHIRLPTLSQKDLFQRNFTIPQLVHAIITVLTDICRNISAEYSSETDNSKF